MKKGDALRMEGICNKIESFLNSLNDEDRKYAGIILCQYSATFAVSDDVVEIFAPLLILSEATKRLTETIDREFLDVVGKECVKTAKNKK